MQGWHSSNSKSQASRRARLKDDNRLGAVTLQLVDLCLAGVIFAAPLFFGGRHPVGRFIYVTVALLGCVSWCAHQVATCRSHHAHTRANYICLAAIALVAAQMIPLPVEWLETLAPRNLSLLQLWNNGESGELSFGHWKTLTLTPSATRIGLATTIAHTALFFTVAGRIQHVEDIKRILRWIGISAVAFSTFGLLQYLTSNGRFFWFYEYPFTTTDRAVKASFSTRNHFAHFVSLGTPALLAWIVIVFQRPNANRPGAGYFNRTTYIQIVLHAGLAICAVAVLGSLSRGGIIAFALASGLTVLLYRIGGLLTNAYVLGLVCLGTIALASLSSERYDLVANRVSDITAGSLEQLDANEARRKIWAANLTAASEGSLFGSGSGSHAEIYPVYLQESTVKDYSHAESSYLQIFTEMGYLGLSLMALSMLTVMRWGWYSVFHTTTREQRLLSYPLAAAIMVSLVHAVFDFVWFIPACMSQTLILAACLLRLSQMTDATTVAAAKRGERSRLAWKLRVCAASIAAVWSISTSHGSAVASLSWDDYLRASIDGDAVVKEARIADSDVDFDRETYEMNLVAMIRNLQRTLKAYPDFARAHLRLANKYTQLFELRQANSDNAMSILQISEAARQSNFKAATELHKWLAQAFHENSQLLYRAHYHAVQAVQLSPLQGEGYIILAKLSFLEGRGIEGVLKYVDQGLAVRPYSGRVLFHAGLQLLHLQRLEQAMALWQQIYRDPGQHRQKIIGILAGQIPAQGFVELFAPDWQTLRILWEQYVNSGGPEDLHYLVGYAQKIAQRETSLHPPQSAAYIWYNLAKMQSQLGAKKQAIVCSKYACQLNPNNYWMRRTFGQRLLEAGYRQAAAEHLRWCVARKPDDEGLREELIAATKTELANPFADPTMRK